MIKDYVLLMKLEPQLSFDSLVLENELEQLARGLLGSIWEVADRPPYRRYEMSFYQDFDFIRQQVDRCVGQRVPWRLRCENRMAEVGWTIAESDEWRELFFAAGM